MFSLGEPQINELLRVPHEVIYPPLRTEPVVNGPSARCRPQTLLLLLRQTKTIFTRTNAIARLVRSICFYLCNRSPVFLADKRDGLFPFTNRGDERDGVIERARNEWNVREKERGTSMRLLPSSGPIKADSTSASTRALFTTRFAKNNLTAKLAVNDLWRLPKEAFSKRGDEITRKQHKTCASVIALIRQNFSVDQ